MKIFCTGEFISEVKLIIKSTSHKDCEAEIILNIFTKSLEEIKIIGTKRLGGDPNKSPFLRKRIETENGGKSSGYRLYFWLLITDECVYLLFIHPKTGRRSGTNLADSKQKELVNTFTEHKKRKSFIPLILNKEKDKIVFANDIETNVF